MQHLPLQSRLVQTTPVQTMPVQPPPAKAQPTSAALHLAALAALSSITLALTPACGDDDDNDSFNTTNAVTDDDDNDDDCPRGYIETADGRCIFDDGSDDDDDDLTTTDDDDDDDNDDTDDGLPPEKIGVGFLDPCDVPGDFVLALKGDEPGDGKLGDPVFQGDLVVTTTPADAWNIFADDPITVRIGVDPVEDPTDTFFNFNFSTLGLEAPLSVQRYDDAVTYDASPHESASMSVSSPGRVCRDLTAAFEVHRIEFVNNYLTRFSASFTQECKGSKSQLRGCVRVERPAACIPNCCRKYRPEGDCEILATCGADGCGGICGDLCAESEVCAAGECKTYAGPLECRGRTATALDSPWPMDRGCAARPGTSGFGAPETAPVILWQIPASGSIQSAPAIGSNGRVYVAASADADGALYSLLDIGGIEWRAPLTGPAPEGSPPGTLGRPTGVGRSGPAIAADGTIYIGALDGLLYAFNPSGTIKWRADAGAPIQTSPLIMEDGSIIVGTGVERGLNGKLLVFDAEGTQTFEIDELGPIFANPAANEFGAYFYADDFGAVGGYGDVANDRWNIISYTEPFRGGMAVSGDGIVYVGGDDGVLHAFSFRGADLWGYPTAGAIRFAPSIARNGNVCFGATDKTFNCVTGDKGELVTTFKTPAALCAPPLVDRDGKFILGTEDGFLRVYDPDGNELYNYQFTGERIAASPVLGDEGLIYIVTTAGQIYAFGARVETPPAD